MAEAQYGNFVFFLQALEYPDQGGDLRAGDVGVEPARVAVGHEAVAHLDPGIGPRFDRPRGAEVDVVGMRHDGEHAGDAAAVAIVEEGIGRRGHQRSVVCAAGDRACPAETGIWDQMASWRAAA